MVAEPKPVTESIQIVPMRRKHLNEVMRIEASEYVRPWTSTLFLSELAQKTRRYTVATTDGVVVGYTGLMLIQDEGHVNTLTVDGNFQRRGIGTMLLLDLARAAADGGSHHIILEVREHNEGAKALYMQFGFAPIGIRRNYYEETGENAIVMCARDVNTSEYTQRLDRIESKLTFKQ
jgi:[ribosomal protein S18]-alanine N-acetyltransferase